MFSGQVNGRGNKRGRGRDKGERANESHGNINVELRWMVLYVNLIVLVCVPILDQTFMFQPLDDGATTMFG